MKIMESMMRIRLIETDCEGQIKTGDAVRNRSLRTASPVFSVCYVVDYSPFVFSSTTSFTLPATPSSTDFTSAPTSFALPIA